MKSCCRTLLIVAAASVLLTDPCAASDTVGIYFDERAESTCVAGHLFTPISAYLVICEPTATGGVLGWEGTLGFDPGLYVSVAQYYGNCLNVTQFPEFAVGLASPLPAGASVVIARLSVFATAPGGLWFGPASRPSIQGATTPIYVGADDVLRPMTPASSEPLAIIGYADCGALAELDSIPSLGDVATVFIGGGNVQSPDVVVQFAHGDQTGELGYSPAIGEDMQPTGIADFDIGADGFTYLLDSVNNRVAVLDQELNWIETIPVEKGMVSLKERNGQLIMEHRTGDWVTACRTKSGWITGVRSLGADKSVYQPGKTESALEIRGARVSPTSFHIEGRYQAQALKSAPPAFNWDIHLAQPSNSISLAINEIVHGGLLLCADYTKSGIGSDVDLIAVGGDGSVVKTIELPTTLNTDYRLPFTTRAGLDGSVVTVRVFGTFTEVAKWRW